MTAKKILNAAASVKKVIPNLISGFVYPDSVSGIRNALIVIMTCALRSASEMYWTCFDCALLSTDPRKSAGQFDGVTVCLSVSGIFICWNSSKVRAGRLSK